VLTGNEETWGTSESLLFLGEWCKRYDRRDIWTNREFKTVPFHWNNREKLHRDYNYLESLHNTLIGVLSQSLNHFHNVSYSERYWQILLDPWLMSYLGVMFDRWECLRYAFLYGDSSALTVLMVQSSNLSAPNSYEDYIQKAAYSDDWNQSVYQRIIEFQYKNKLKLLFGSNKSITKSRNSSLCKKNESFINLSKLISRWWSSINRFQDVVFLGMEHSFSRLERLKLNLALWQFPVQVPLIDYQCDTYRATHTSSAQSRSSINLDWSEHSDFEKFLKYFLVIDLPKCIVEDFFLLRSYANELLARPRIIVTGSSHWISASSRAWISEMTASNTKFVILEHGGSLPPFKELFNFEVNIADIRVTWFKPYSRKHLQLPAAKLVGRYGKIFRLKRKLFRRKYCSLIGNECPLWVHRAHFYPMAQQWTHSFAQVLELHRGLKSDIKHRFRIKPYPTPQGWSTGQRFSDELGDSIMHRESSLDRVYAMSKVIICTYPETTFSEAMASGVPTILIYTEQFYELNPVVYPLLDLLKAAKIVFLNPVDAANHLNSIWEDIDAWWGRSDTLEARLEFRRQALSLESVWVRRWSEFLTRLARQSK